MIQLFRRWLKRRRLEADKKVLVAIHMAHPDGAYGLGMMRETKLSSRRLYSTLDRLIASGLVIQRREANPGDRPPRQLYFVGR